MPRLSNRTVIVTGGAQGIGATYAKALAAEGARVSVCDIQPPDATVAGVPAKVLKASEAKQILQDLEPLSGKVLIEAFAFSI